MSFLLRRAVLAVAVLFVFSFLTFCPFAANTFPLSAHPVLSNYREWLAGLVSGSSYHSLIFPYGSLVSTVLHGVAHTATLLALAFVFTVLLSISVAVLGAFWRGSGADILLRGATYLAWGVPAFLLGLVVQQVLSDLGSQHGLGPFPLAGWPGSCPAGIGINAGTISGCPTAGSGAHYVLNVLRYVTLPAATLALGVVGLHGRYLRSVLVETLDAPFIVTARAKGLSERAVILRHALRPSLTTFSSVILADFGAVFGAALAVDWVFQMRGVGTLLILAFPQADGARPIDVYLVEALLIVTAIFLLSSSLLGELAVHWFDPRTREART